MRHVPVGHSAESLAEEGPAALLFLAWVTREVDHVAWSNPQQLIEVRIPRRRVYKRQYCARVPLSLKELAQI